ncbi:hypothetical protein GCM10020001_055890 [Nonomuraea salmonea]
MLYRPLFGLSNFELRLHRTILYNSIYRADGDLLINMHVYGNRAANAPRPAPAQGGRRGDGHHVRRELRKSLGRGRPRRVLIMAKRIDYYDDPAAPAPNSLVPSVNVIVTNAAGDLLMIHRTDNDNWAVPGGAIDLGESIPTAAVRETVEETGITCEITGLVGTYSDPPACDPLHQQR